MSGKAPAEKTAAAEKKPAAAKPAAAKPAAAKTAAPADKKGAAKPAEKPAAKAPKAPKAAVPKKVKKPEELAAAKAAVKAKNKKFLAAKKTKAVAKAKAVKDAATKATAAKADAKKKGEEAKAKKVAKFKPENDKKAAAKRKLEAPEVLLKARKRKLAGAVRQAKAALIRAKKVKAKRSDYFKRAEKYEKEYRDLRKQEVILRRKARAAGKLYSPPESKIAVVVRIRGIMNHHPRVRAILRLLRLRQINNCSFVRLSSATVPLLRLVEPYIAYGYPSLKTIRMLIYKRGHAKINSQRIPITNNAMVEKELGKKGVICVEDIVHEIFTCGPNFKAVNGFLWPFKLNPPRGGFKDVRRHFVEGGDCGNREVHINKLVQRMV